MGLAKLSKIAGQIAKIQDLDEAVDLRNKVKAIAITEDC